MSLVSQTLFVFFRVDPNLLSFVLFKGPRKLDCKLWEGRGLHCLVHHNNHPTHTHHLPRCTKLTLRNSLLINRKTGEIREKEKRDRQIETRRREGHREEASSLESAKKGTGDTR